jgi:hypothetical protein
MSFAAMASAGDVPGAQAAAATLEPFWDGARAPDTGGKGQGLGFLGKALRAADAVADAETAAMLLRPFRIENPDRATSTRSERSPTGTVSGGRDLLRTWLAASSQTWAYGGGQARPQWVADWLPGLCAGLHARAVLARRAQRLLDLAWEWTRQPHRHRARVAVAQLPRQETR